jgi:RNA recognition motif-containing protein
MKIFVANLSFNATEAQLKELFEAHGEVQKASVVYDRETNRSRGIAFIEMPVQQEAEAAIESLNGLDFLGRPLRIEEARERQERPGSGGYNGGRGNSGGSRGYGRR